jgi:hypothetical protein
MRVRPALFAVNLVVALIFAWFAWLQRNDIDPTIYYKPSVIDAAIWFVLYLLIGALVLVVSFRAIPRWMLALCALGCLVEMAISGPGLYENLFGDQDFTLMQASMNAEDPRVELSREFFGAVFALLGVAFAWWQNLRLQRGDRS